MVAKKHTLPYSSAKVTMTLLWVRLLACNHQGKPVMLVSQSVGAWLVVCNLLGQRVVTVSTLSPCQYPEWQAARTNGDQQIRTEFV